jgi:capsid protein
MEGANFSSARVNVIDSRRRYAQRQKNIIHTLCKPVYRDFVKWEFLTGRVAGKTITDYTQNEWGLTQALWTPDPYEWVDPLKDVQALKEEAEQGWLTDESYFEAKGRDRDSVYAVLAEEKKAKKALDIAPEPKTATGKPAVAEENNAE